MPQEGETPAFEQSPRLPEGSAETPERGASFETPAPGTEQPSAPVPSPATTSAAPAPAQPAKDPTLRQVEDVLEEGLAEVYKKMDPAHQARFSKEGDRVAGRVTEMIRQARVRAREVLSLISNWLKIIPGVNRFFLDQEAKIKTDRIIALAGEEKKRRGV